MKHTNLDLMVKFGYVVHGRLFELEQFGLVLQFLLKLCDLSFQLLKSLPALFTESRIKHKKKVSVEQKWKTSYGRAGVLLQF